MKTFALAIGAIGIVALAQVAGAYNIRIDIPSHFTSGDSVCFTWVNDDTIDVCGYSAPPWRIYDSDSAGVAPCAVLWIIVNLPAGESIRYCWDQKDCSGNQVSDGTYTVCIRYGTGTECNYADTVCQTFTISEQPSPSNKGSWGRLKAFYR